MLFSALTYLVGVWGGWKWGNPKGMFLIFNFAQGANCTLSEVIHQEPTPAGRK